MRPALKKLFVAAALLLAGLAVADPEVFRVVVTRPKGASGTVVVPDRFLRPWDPVTVFFAGDVGRPGPEDHPERFVTVSPAHPGAWTWLDARTLQFQPAEMWPALGRYTWDAGGRPVELATLFSPPLVTTPADGAEGLGPVDTIVLGFDDPLDADALARMVRVELRPAPGLGGEASTWLGRDDFRIKEVDVPPQTLTEETWSPGDTGGGRYDVVETTVESTYALVLDRPIPLGTRAIVHFRLSADDADASFARVSFATAEPFRVVRAGCASQQLPLTPAGTRYEKDQAIACTSGSGGVAVDFSAVPDRLGPVEARNLVRFSPAVEDLELRLDGRRLSVTGRFEPETAYQLTVAPTPLRDTAGRALEIAGPSTVWLYFPRREAYLRFAASEGVVERDGPQTVPLEGRGATRADLRVYRIDPLDRSFWPFPPNPVAVDESIRPPGPGEEPAPFSEPASRIGADALAAQIRALGSPPRSALVDLPLRPAAGAARFGLDLAPHLAYVSGKGAPGTYLVGVRNLDASTTRSYLRLTVTDLSLTAVEEADAVRFLVTSLSSGSPLGGVEVRLEGAREGDEGLAWATLASGKTGADGAWVFRAPGETGDGARLMRVVATKGADVLVVDAARAPSEFADDHWGEDGDADWLQWAFEELTWRRPQAETLCHVFTERPVYRPEEEVHLRGWVRRREKGAIAPVVVEKGQLVVTGPGNLVFRHDAPAGETGGFYRRFAEPKLPTGTYTARYVVDGKDCGRVSFQLEAYRIPTFEVVLSGEEKIPLDRPGKVALTASYYAGGRVAARPIRWRVTQFPFTWVPKAREGFVWSSDGRFSGQRRFDATPRWVQEAKTDAQGAASLVLDPTIEPTAQPRQYVVEATVTGEDDQTVTSTKKVLALPPFVIGAKLPRYLERATAVEPEILVAGPTGDPLAGQALTVRLKRRQWHSVLQAADFSEGEARYVTDVVDEVVAEKAVVSGASPTKLSFPIDRAGVYVVEAEGRDRLGRAQVVAVDLYAGGDQPVAWEKPQAGVFEVAADAASYVPGQTANLVLQSPFSSGEALVVIEAPTGNRYAWTAVRNGAATVKVPIDKAWAPRFPVHVVLMRGRVPDTGPVGASTQDAGKPQTVAATTWITVEPVENRVSLALAAPAKATPGETVPITITLTKPDRKPAAGEVALWLVDAAVLALGKEQRLDPLPDFVTPFRSLLRFRDTRNRAFGRVPFAEMPGGDGGEDDDDPLDRATVRKDFRSVPYYEPALKVGPDGKLTVSVKLPDNLTTFKLRAKVASGPDRFGFGTGEIAVRLPVLVQPALPRFVRPGDTFVATGVARVTEGPGGAGTVQMRAEGLKLAGGEKQALTLDAEKAVLARFPVTVETPTFTPEGALSREAVKVRMAVSRQSDGAADAFEVVLPLRDDREPVVARQLVKLEGPVEVPGLPEPARPGTVRRTWVASGQTGLVLMASALEYFEDYPYGCTEQRVSEARAWLALGSLREALALRDGAARTKRAVEETLGWLPGVVDGHGLVGAWPATRGRVALTAWTLELLVEAEAEGYAVDRALKETLVESLTRSLRSDAGWFVGGEAWTERAMALQALARAGKLDAAYFAELSRTATFLEAEGVANVVLAGARSDAAATPVMDKLVKALADGVVTRLWQGKEVYGGLQAQRTPRDPLVYPSETRTLATITRALSAARPAHPRLPLLVDALVTLGRDDGWGSTNANAEALFALAQRLRAPPAAPWKVVVSGEESFTLAPGEADVATAVRTSAGRVTVSRESAAPLALRVETRFWPQRDGSTVAPEAKGYVVSRAIERVRADGPGDKLAIDAAGTRVTLKVGDVVEEKVTVVVPESRSQVAVVIPLAAGLEPLNPRLATAPPEATPSARATLAPTYEAWRDDEVRYFYDALPKGTYVLVFRARATVAGDFVMPPALAQSMYDLGVRGNSAGARVEVQQP
ncbi:MAG: alpha-2-macroglobulin [Myxococcota bacterium]